jgi:nitrite reductase/ring-hydroxylating ferredoxin subunit
MLGRLFIRMIDAQNGWARPFGDWLHGVAAAIFGRMVPVRSFFNGTWLGHPVHAVLTDVPIGALFLVIVLDLLGQPVGADVALVLGVLAMAGAAVVGFADYSVTDGSARVRATVHSTVMIVALLVYLVSLGLRAGSPADRSVPIGLSIVGFLILSAGAYVGGDVVFLLGNMVDRHAWRPAGAKWATLEVAELEEGVPMRGKVGIQNLVVVRWGDTIHALHDQCAHAGGPLSGGRVVDGCIECPWHGSRFELATGRRRRGPTVYDQPAYEVRAAEGGGYEVRRVS